MDLYWKEMFVFSDHGNGISNDHQMFAKVVIDHISMHMVQSSTLKLFKKKLIQVSGSQQRSNDVKCARLQ